MKNELDYDKYAVSKRIEESLTDEQKELQREVYRANEDAIPKLEATIDTLASTYASLAIAEGKQGDLKKFYRGHSKIFSRCGYINIKVHPLDRKGVTTQRREKGLSPFTDAEWSAVEDRYRTHADKYLRTIFTEEELGVLREAPVLHFNNIHDKESVDPQELKRVLTREVEIAEICAREEVKTAVYVFGKEPVKALIENLVADHQHRRTVDRKVYETEVIAPGLTSGCEYSSEHLAVLVKMIGDLHFKFTGGFDTELIQASEKAKSLVDTVEPGVGLYYSAYPMNMDIEFGLYDIKKEFEKSLLD
jgi:hypothetical protein